MRKIRTVIVDDEPDALNFIDLIIKENCLEVEICGLASSAVEAIKLIQNQKPDLVLLDIEMPDATGFDVLESLPDREFKVIFITAYNQHAIKAFKYSAFDYILKPIDVDELTASINEITEIIRSGKNAPDINTLIKNIQAPEPIFIAVPTGTSIDYIEINKIIRVEADNRYSIIHSTNEKFIITKSIGEYESLLSLQGFFRVHNSHLVNLKKIKSYVKKDGGYITMIDDSQVPLSRRCKDQFRRQMEQFSIK